MMKSVFAFALMAMSGTALAYQQLPAPADDTAEAAVSAEDVDAAGEAQTAEADEAAAAEDQLSDKENYRAAVKAFSKCRANARRDNSPAAAANACTSQRKRMMAAKEVLKGSN
jgi:hypothetical protein